MIGDVVEVGDGASTRSGYMSDLNGVGWRRWGARGGWLQWVAAWWYKAAEVGAGVVVAAVVHTELAE